MPKACQHDGELTYYAANAKQHTIFCEKCQKEIGVEDHDFSIHKSGSMDSKTGVFYPIDSEDYHQGDVYGEADICSKCGVAANFKSAAVLGDANNDNELNVRDCSFIAQALANRKGDTLPESADYNKDGKKNVIDAMEIAKYLATVKK